MKDRDYLFDNIKAFLIFGVTLVHFMAAARSEFGSNDITDFIMLIICSFHMPLFMFVSGFFSKRSNTKGLVNLMIIYTVVQILFLFYNCLTGAKFSNYSITRFLSPGFSMWYLFAIVVLKLFLPAILLIKNKKGVLIVLFIISILAMGCSMDGAFETAFVKTMANAIYFVVGVYVGSEQIELIRRKPKWVYFIGFLLGCICLLLVTVVFQIMPSNYLRIMMLRAKNISEVSMDGTGYIIYLFILLFAIYMSVMLIGLFPANKTIISTYGKNSLTIYIGQAFAYLIFKEMIARTSGITLGVGYIAALILAFVVTVVMGSNFISSNFKKMISIIQNMVCAE